MSQHSFCSIYFFYIFPRNLYWTRRNGLKYKFAIDHHSFSMSETFKNRKCPKLLMFLQGVVTSSSDRLAIVIYVKSCRVVLLSVFSTMTIDHPFPNQLFKWYSLLKTLNCLWNLKKVTPGVCSFCCFFAKIFWVSHFVEFVLGRFLPLTINFSISTWLQFAFCCCFGHITITVV